MCFRYNIISGTIEFKTMPDCRCIEIRQPGHSVFLFYVIQTNSILTCSRHNVIMEQKLYSGQNCHSLARTYKLELDSIAQGIR